MVRLFDVLIDGEEILFQVKTGRNEYETITLGDVLYQIESAKNCKIRKQEALRTERFSVNQFCCFCRTRSVDDGGTDRGLGDCAFSVMSAVAA